MHVREPQQERGIARRNAVLEGAARVFEQYGYGQSSLKQITEASGATTGSVYFYFSTKEAIALAIIDEQNRRTLAWLEGITEGRHGLEALVATSHAVADAMLSDVVVRAGIRLSLEQGTLTAPTAQYYKQWSEGIVPALQDAEAAGELSTPLSHTQIAETLVPYFTGVHVVSDILNGRAKLYPGLRVMWTVFLGGISSPDHLGRLLQLVDECFDRPQPAVPVHPGT